MSVATEISIFNGASPAAPGTSKTTAVPGFGGMEALTIVATVQGATGGTLDFIVQNSADGVHFYDYWRPLAAPLAGAAAAATYKTSPVLDNATVQIGIDLTPAIAVSSDPKGHWYEYLQVVFIAGAGTSAGAVQNIRAMGVRKR